MNATTTKNWHAQSVDDALTALNASPAGLPQADALARLQTFGPNRLPEPPRRSVLKRLLLQFHNILIYVLLASALITAALGLVADTLVIVTVVLANALIGFIQEGKAEKAIEAIRRMLALRCSVIRDGERVTVAGEMLVPGDVVLLEAGDKVPADLRLLKSHGLQMQEAVLTGESLPVQKSVAAVASDSALGDRSCMAFSGTLVTNGQGMGVVVTTGASTEIGRISGLLAQIETLTTPLVTQMNTFAKWLTILILLLAGMLLTFGYFVGHREFAEVFIAVVALAVAAIPEGLPAVLTITLAIGVRSMAQRNAIVRRLPAIETLGAVSVICTDKTGTLTRNEMMVTTGITHCDQLTITGTGYAPHGDIRREGQGQALTDDQLQTLNELARAAALCNDAALHEHESDWTTEGDPMEGALLAFAGKAGIDAREQSRLWTRSDTIAFDPRHRFMATLHHDHNGHASVFVKGAPERILSMCAAQRTAAGETIALDPHYWQQQAERIAALGQRVLAVAAKALPAQHALLKQTDFDGTLILLGMVGMIDPPREEAIAAVAECHAAGIRVKMITGDHAGTAAAIGRQIGLQNANAVLTGADLDGMDDAALAIAVLQTDIFARTSPEHKLRLVMTLQAHGMRVAMTGDGVNDAPALRRADVGIAMGKRGSEAAKEAAELVLADDNFASIVVAVREGRTVYDNITKVISWTLPTNAGEAGTIILALLLGMTLPVTPIQILWVNLVTAVTLGVALAFERTEPGTMQRPPRPRNTPILTGTLAWHILLVAFLFVCGVFGMYSYAIERGYSIELARTIALNTLVVMEIFHLFFIRNIYGTSLTWEAMRGTKVIWLIVVAITAAQFLLTYFPPLQAVFDTVAVPLLDGLLIVAVGIALFAIIETEKQLRLRLRKMRSA